MDWNVVTASKETGAEHRTTEEYRERLWKEAQQKEAEVEENNKTIEGNKKDYRYSEQHHGFSESGNQTCGCSFEGFADYD